MINLNSKSLLDVVLVGGLNLPGTLDQTSDTFIKEIGVNFQVFL